VIERSCRVIKGSGADVRGGKCSTFVHRACLCHSPGPNTRSAGAAPNRNMHCDNAKQL